MQKEIAENDSRDRINYEQHTRELNKTISLFTDGLKEISKSVLCLSTELRKIEEKVLEREDKSKERMGNIAQALVKLETEVKNLIEYGKQTK